MSYISLTHPTEVIHIFNPVVLKLLRGKAVDGNLGIGDGDPEHKNHHQKC